MTLEILSGWRGSSHALRRLDAVNVEVARTPWHEGHPRPRLFA